MPISLITFAASGSGLVLIIGLKATVFKDRHMSVWVKVRETTDRFLHRTVSGTKTLSKQATHQSLLKILSVVYHGIIPFVEKTYRATASLVYKGHRKFWTLLERSKHSTSQVSEYLRRLSEHKNKKDGDQGQQK